MEVFLHLDTEKLGSEVALVIDGKARKDLSSLIITIDAKGFPQVLLGANASLLLSPVQVVAIKVATS